MIHGWWVQYAGPVARPGMIVVRFSWRALFLLVPALGGLVVQPAAAQDWVPARAAIADGLLAPKTDLSFLSSLGEDPALTLLASSSSSTLRVPLAPGDWSFLKGVQPYALFNPSTIAPIGGVWPTLPGLLGEPTEDSWKGLGVGAGFQWHLSGRLDLFGQYQFLSLPGADAPTGSPVTRREAESPGVKAGFSIHF
jgi:hypothetical protein